VLFLPRLFDECMSLLKQMLELYGRKPDMISLSSGIHFLEFLFIIGLRNLLGCSRLEVHTMAPVRIEVGQQRLKRWMERAERFVDIVESIVLNTFMMWRTLYPCIVYSPSH
jgi:hypothetical protein